MSELPAPRFENLKRLPAFWLGLAFLGGIVTAQGLPLPLAAWGAAAGVGLLPGIAALFLKPLGWKGFLPLLFFLGAARLALANLPPGPQDLAFYNDTPRKIWLTGYIYEPPDLRDSSALVKVHVTALDFGSGDQPVSGNLLLRLDHAEGLAYGSVLRVRGLLKTPAESDEFSYRAYLHRQGIDSVLTTPLATKLPFDKTNPLLALLYRAQKGIYQRVYRLFPDPEASLAAGILVGKDKGMTASLTQAFTDTGTSHIIAISGFNIAIVAGLFVGLFSRLLGKTWGGLLAIAAIAAYTLLVGADASVVRAAIMGSLSILAGQSGRRNFGLNTLLVVAVFMAAWNPLILQDVGFQLSFAATLGLVLFASPLQEAFGAFLRRFLPLEWVEKLIGPLSDYILLTLAAQLTTLPVIVYHFQRISLVSFLINPLILPAQPPVMIFAGLAALLSRLYFPLGQALAWFTLPFLAYTIRMVETFASLPHGVFSLDLGEMAGLLTLTYYTLLIGFTLASETTRAWLKPLLQPSALLTTLAALAFLTGRAALNAPDGRLTLTAFNVGQGHALLLQSPSGGQILFNGGASLSRISDGLGRRLSPFNRRLDLLIIGSTQETEVAALPLGLLDRYPPQQIVWSGAPQASYSARRFFLLAQASQAPLTIAQKGMRFDLGQGAVLEAVSVSSRGSIWLLRWGKFSALLPLGTTFGAYQELQNGRAIGPVNVLLLAEGGYAPANPRAWLQNLAPQVYLLSIDAANDSGLPSHDLLKQLEGQTLLRTDENGWIKISTDGETFEVETEKMPNTQPPGQ